MRLIELSWKCMGSSEEINYFRQIIKKKKKNIVYCLFVSSVVGQFDKCLSKYHQLVFVCLQRSPISYAINKID
jgi:hypothetical protein